MGVNKYFSVVFWIVGRSKNPILLKCLLFQLGMGKTDQKVWTKKSFSTKKEKQQKKN